MANAWSEFLSSFIHSQEGNFVAFLWASSLIKLLVLGRAKAVQDTPNEEEKEEEKGEKPLGGAGLRKELVGHLSTIYYYPVKSCGGITLSHAECGYAGLTSDGATDRQWVLTDNRGVFITANQQPSLVLVKPSFHGNEMNLDVSGMPTLSVVPLDAPRTSTVQTKLYGVPVDGVDCGDEASNWFNTYLGTSASRLLNKPSWVKRRVQDGVTKWHKNANESQLLTYQKESPYLLVSEASIEDLNTRLADPVTVRHFRPNFVISGCSAYEEDNWTHIYIGDAVFTKMKLLQRCPITTIDPDTGVKNTSGEPLATLKRYRHKPEYKNPSPSLCSSLLLETPGAVRSGDPVYVIRQ